MLEHVRLHPCVITETPQTETEKHRSAAWFLLGLDTKIKKNALKIYLEIHIFL